MNINLDNYESFFLLYVDNELSAAERKRVEEFLGDYPYLQAELKLLKETVLPVEQNNYEFKSALLKPVMSAEAEQEQLLLHLDNELQGEEKQQLERRLLKETELQKEWSLLKKTKLDAAELVAFPDKKILFRHESGRLVFGRFARLAVAAAIVGAGIFIGINMPDKNEKIPGDELATNSGRSASETVIPDVITGKTGTGLAATTVTGGPASKVKEVTDQPLAKIKSVKPDKAAMKSKVVPGDEIAAANNNKTTTGKPVLTDDPRKEIRRSLPGRQQIARVDLPGKNDEGRNSTAIAGVKNKPTLADVNIQEVENLFARTAAFDEEENSDDHIFMMDEDKVSRTKAAGFLKKIKRTVERTTKIKAGNSLKIAGFEFAVK